MISKHAEQTSYKITESYGLMRRLSFNYVRQARASKKRISEVSLATGKNEVGEF